jgi:Holliday junction DNA helicase RuvB
LSRTIVLRPELYTFEIGPELLAKLRPLILEALWHEAERSQIKTLSISRAKELLAVAQPTFRDLIPLEGQPLATAMLLPQKTISTILHDALAQGASFFRREGAQTFRSAQQLADIDARTARLWTTLFDRKLSRWLREQGYLDASDQIESVDVVVEAVRAWVRDFAQRLRPGTEISPSAFFLDSESDLEATVAFEGRKLRFRGRPDALIIDPSHGAPAVIEYKLGTQSQVELQVAQTVLYVSLVDAAKGTKIERACVQFFRLVGDIPPDAAEEAAGTAGSSAAGIAISPSAFPEQVVDAFAGYVGNAAAVRRLKIECSVAVASAPVKMPINLMLCGSGGLGKTELARRVAKALALPFVDVPANTIQSVDGFLKRVRATLSASGVEPEEAGTDSGLPRHRYPALVVFLDEIHLLKKPDQFLNLFEPKERRAVGSTEVGDLSAATFIGATTDKGLLAGPFRSRFNTIDLEPYSAEEIAALVAPAFAPPLTVDQAFLVALADMSRRNPREALRKAQEAKTHHRFDPSSYPLTLRGLLQIAKEVWQVDERGLNNLDREYLRALRTGPRGFSSLSQLLPVGADEIRTIIEPYVLQLGLVDITPKGRELTELGRRLIGGIEVERHATVRAGV